VPPTPLRGAAKSFLKTLFPANSTLAESNK